MGEQWYVVLKKIAPNSNLKMITEERVSSGTIFCTIVIISPAAMLSRLVHRIPVSLFSLLPRFKSEICQMQRSACHYTLYAMTLSVTLKAENYNS
jgi:hypothetical protein